MSKGNKVTSCQSWRSQKKSHSSAIITRVDQVKNFRPGSTPPGSESLSKSDRRQLCRLTHRPIFTYTYNCIRKETKYSQNQFHFFVNPICTSYHKSNQIGRFFHKKIFLCNCVLVKTNFCLLFNNHFRSCSITIKSNIAVSI